MYIFIIHILILIDKCFCDKCDLIQSHFYYLRIQYEDTDAGGIVYHANYLSFMERARTGLMRLLNLSPEKFLISGNSIVVIKDDIKWKSSLTLGNICCVKTHLLGLKRASFILEQVIYDNQLNKVFTIGKIYLCIIKNNKVVKLPLNLKQALLNWSNQLE